MQVSYKHSLAPIQCTPSSTPRSNRSYCFCFLHRPLLFPTKNSTNQKPHQRKKNSPQNQSKYQTKVSYRRIESTHKLRTTLNIRKRDDTKITHNHNNINNCCYVYYNNIICSISVIKLGCQLGFGATCLRIETRSFLALVFDFVEWKVKSTKKASWTLQNPGPCLVPYIVYFILFSHYFNQHRNKLCLNWFAFGNIGMHVPIQKENKSKNKIWIQFTNMLLNSKS